MGQSSESTAQQDQELSRTGAAQADKAGLANDARPAAPEDVPEADEVAAAETTAGARRRGLLLIHTGPGKGKTTAALGVGMRALGSGMRVLFLQFLKGSWDYGELHVAEGFAGNFDIRQLGRGFVKVGGAEMDPEDLRLVAEGWATAVTEMNSGDWDVVVLDEILYAIGYGMLDAAEVAVALQGRPEMLHVILTGRNAPPLLVELADTVTEMREVKHAYTRGILAQRGIEF